MADTQYHLSYKTRGDSSPQGKPKVYFCCHPDDFGYLFEEISNEILAEQNCSVWYADPVDAVRDEEFLNDLSQMQLFVMPVTAKLLYLKNHAIDVEFPFAVEHHIPILPLMQESDLEGIFNQKCADLQFLDKNARDATAIPYEEKFRAYLSSVLIGDELAQKVRDAFDAYIFLSYRKKDRKYAQELMRLIHKNKSCRDIAIWYDEFLIPGENFNDAIRQALNKSDLFVMTVTPNLITEKNYIMTTEYPMAKDAGKPILPAEMVKTDRGALAEKYQQLPIPTDAHNEIALSETLLSTIQNLAIKENDDSPEHSFFIGLAYLGGIDVEVDHERALTLIRSAAEAGLPEAMEKLIRMYEAGEGVARDYQAAIAWREKKIARSEKIYRDSPDEASLNQFFWDVIDCGDAYYSLGRYPLAREKYEYAKDLIENSNIWEKSPKIRRDLAVCYQRLGGIQSGVTSTKSYREKSFAIFEELYRETGTLKARRDLVVAYRLMGLPGVSGEKDVSYREKAIAMAEELIRETGSIEDRQLLLDCCFFHGALLKISRGGNLPAARIYYEKAFALSEALYQELGTLQARRDFATGYTALASICEALGDTDAGLGYYEKELQLREELARETDSVWDRSRLADVYYFMARTCQKKGDFKNARSYYEKELVLRERLTHETEGTRDGASFYSCCDHLGALCKDMGDLSGWLHYYEKGIEAREIIAQKSGKANDYDHVATFCYKLSKEIPERRTAYLQKAIGIYEKLCEQYPEKSYYSQRVKSLRDCLPS